MTQQTLKTYFVFRRYYCVIQYAMPNWNFVLRQLKFDKPRYLFTKTHKPKTKTFFFHDKNNAFVYIYLMETSSL